MTRRRLSFAVVLIAVLVAVVTVVLGSFATLAYRHEAREHYERLQGDLASAADQMAVALALPMWNIDNAQLRSIVGSGMNDQDMYAIEAKANDQHYLLVRDAQWRAVEGKAVPAAEDLVVQERTVQHNGETIGQVRLYASPRFVVQDLEGWRNSALLFIVALDIGLVLSLAAMLWWFMLRPIKALEHYAAAVEAGGSPAAPERVLFFGELESLRDSISQMIEMLNSRYHALRDSEERLKLATQSASIGVWDWNVVTGDLSLDDELQRIYGMEPGEFSGRVDKWFELLEPEAAQKLWAEVQQTFDTHQPFDTEFEFPRPDGDVRILACGGTVTRDASGRPVRMVGANFDITEMRKAERALSQLNAELEQRVEERTGQLMTAIDEVSRARDLAESATRAKSEFLANMSHEIRTPMNAVMGMTELALRGDLAPKQRDYLTKAKSAAESLLGVLNDILDFSKIEAGKLDMEHRAFALKDVLQQVVNLVGLRAQERGLRLQFSVDAQTPARLVGDPLRLEQVLVNLCTNAVKFTEQGAVRLTVEPVTPPPDTGSTVLRFSVQDSGIGMTPEQLAGLFQPFNQLDSSTTRKYGGTGLGLAICKRLVELMGGQISATSEPGRGSTFHFTAAFGMAEASAAEAPAELRRADDSASFAALRGRHVLLVEDNELNQIVASELLRDACGMQVTVAASGPQALTLLAGTAFDIVLMDVQMPDMDGYEVTRRLRSDPAHAGLPIIAMTAHALARDREKCTTAGMNDFVPKPFDPQELFGVLNKWLQGPSTPVDVAPRDSEPAVGVSVEAGLKSCLGKADLYEKIVRRYLTTRTQMPEEIRAALQADDRATAARIAHSLISTAGIIGAMAMSATARDLQRAIEADDAPRTAHLLGQIALQHTAACADLEAYLSRL